MYMDMNKWSQEIIDAKDVRFMPVYYFPNVKNTKYKVVETLKDCDGAPMAEVMKNCIDQFPEMIGATTAMDLTVDAEAFGCEIQFTENDSPAVRTHPVKTMEDAQALQVPDVHCGRLDIHFDAVRKAQELITDRPIFGGMLGPFSLAANVMELSECLMATVTDPDLVQVLLRKCTDFLIERAREYKNAGANGVLIAEPTAGLLKAKSAKVFSSVYVKEIVDAVQDDGFFCILHDCGKVVKQSEDMYATGAKGFHFGDSVDMAEIAPLYPQDCLIMGNIKPADMAFKKADDIYGDSMELLEKTKQYPHFVFSSGCDVPVITPFENVDAMIRAMKDFNDKNA